MLPRLYRAQSLSIGLPFRRLGNGLRQEPCKVHGGQVEEHLLLPPLEVETGELLGSFNMICHCRRSHSVGRDSNDNISVARVHIFSRHSEKVSRNKLIKLFSK
ncbi:hypothetical protein HanIR_Chr13g0654381 [Helianthus annuus]|nr:hypothetical protein HanIR_Chr13g0654381 [Helianthus annuus]